MNNHLYINRRLFFLSLSLRFTPPINILLFFPPIPVISFSLFLSLSSRSLIKRHTVLFVRILNHKTRRKCSCIHVDFSAIHTNTSSSLLLPPLPSTSPSLFLSPSPDWWRQFMIIPCDWSHNSKNHSNFFYYNNNTNISWLSVKLSLTFYNVIFHTWITEQVGQQSIIFKNIQPSKKWNLQQVILLQKWIIHIHLSFQRIIHPIQSIHYILLQHIQNIPHRNWTIIGRQQHIISWTIHQPSKLSSQHPL